MKDRNILSSDLKPEYDFDYSTAVRGMYFQRMQNQKTNLVAIDPELSEIFQDSESVNDALRMLLKMSQIAQRANIPAYCVMEK
jgi:hypothetical protein